MGKTLLDQYTYLHFAVGVVVYFFNIPLTLWTLLHILFEVSENTQTGMAFINQYLPMWPGGKPYADSKINSVGDTIGAILGWLSAYLVDSYGKKYQWYYSEDFLTSSR